MADELLGRQSAVAEARGIYKLLSTGHTVEELRELIAVPPRIERVLRAFAQTFPEESYFVDRALKLRSQVLEEFDRLVRDGLPVDLPEEETESEPFAEAVVLAQA